MTSYWRFSIFLEYLRIKDLTSKCLVHLARAGQSNFPPLQKPLRNHCFYVWTETLADMAFMSTKEPSNLVLGVFSFPNMAAAGVKILSPTAILENEKTLGTRLRAIWYRAFLLTWPAPMQICWNKRTFLLKKRVQLPQD